MDNETLDLVWEIVKSLLPALALLFGGGVGMWKYLAAQETKRKEVEAKKSKEEKEYRIEADQKAFGRASATIDRQAIEIKELRTRQTSLEAQVGVLNTQMREKDRQIQGFEECIEELALFKKNMEMLNTQMQEVLLENHELRKER